MINKSIIEFCPVPPPFGGVTVYVKRLSDQLRKDGYSVGGYFTEKCTDKAIISSSNYFKVEPYSCSRNKLNRAFQQIRRMYKYVKQMRSFYIVHYHGLENLKFIWFLHRYCKKFIVITVHSSMIESFYKRTDWINKHYMKKLAVSNVQWIAVSQQAKECMLRLPFRFKKDIPVIPAYVPIQDTELEPLPNNMQEYIRNHDQNLAFYARSFMYNEGVDVYGFDDALKLYASILSKYSKTIGLIFCISEDKDKDKIAKLFTRAKELCIYDKIFWQIGAIKNMNTLWHNIDVYILPTSTAGASVAVGEDRKVLYPINSAIMMILQIKLP